MAREGGGRILRQGGRKTMEGRRENGRRERRRSENVGERTGEGIVVEGEQRTVKVRAA